MYIIQTNLVKMNIIGNYLNKTTTNVTPRIVLQFFLLYDYRPVDPLLDLYNNLVQLSTTDTFIYINIYIHMDFSFHFTQFS